MPDVRDLERAVQELPEEDLRQFRQWFLDFDAELWDRQIERDVVAGKLDDLAAEALADRRAGRTRAL